MALDQIYTKLCSHTLLYWLATPYLILISILNPIHETPHEIVWTDKTGKQFTAPTTPILLATCSYKTQSQIDIEGKNKIGSNF